MKLCKIIAVIFSLSAAPALAGLIQVQEADETVSCELRSASMVTSAPETSVVFPEDVNCLGAEVELRELPKEEGATAIEVAGNFRAGE